MQFDVIRAAWVRGKSLRYLIQVLFNPMGRSLEHAESSENENDVDPRRQQTRTRQDIRGALIPRLY